MIVHADSSAVLCSLFVVLCPVLLAGSVRLNECLSLLETGETVLPCLVLLLLVGALLHFPEAWAVVLIENPRVVYRVALCSEACRSGLCWRIGNDSRL